MVNIELYINKSLVDLSQDFAVRLNRQLLNPAELNKKDAQYSYSIFLPATGNNNGIFRYANVEETSDKFNVPYTAELIIGGVQIFKGNLRLSEISAQGYKGNLYIPNLKTIKDIFGDLKLNENAPYIIPFADFTTSISQYNNEAFLGPRAAIFPYVLYGLLPKVPLNRDANNYSPRNVWDDSVYIGISDLPPSINPLIMLRHIFESKGYNLNGSAFDDEKLTNIYQSYRNPPDYVQPWNYGYHAKINITGSWRSLDTIGSTYQNFERGVNQSSGDTGALYSVDMLDATNSEITINQDTGGNILLKKVNDNSGKPWTRGLIRIPTSGYYKVQFSASLRVRDDYARRADDPATGIQHISGRTQNAGNGLNFENIYEIRLLRDRKTGDFGLSGAGLNGRYYFNNQPQAPDSIPRYFPAPNAINFVDLAQDKNHLLGFQFGADGDNGDDAARPFLNPLEYDKRAQMIAAKPALSWNNANNDGQGNRLVISSPGYMKYGKIGNFDSEGDNPNTTIDYSGGNIISGASLDDQGQLVGVGANLDQRQSKRLIDLTTGDPRAVFGWSISPFIPLTDYADLKYSGEALPEDAALIAFYDVDKLFLGSNLDAPAPGGGSTVVTDFPIGTPPAGSVFVRFCGSDTFTITGTSTATLPTKILYRFPVTNWFKYKFKTPPASLYDGKLFIYNGAALLKVVNFVDGEALVDLAEAGAGALTATLYLKTAEYDVSTSLVISREISGDGSADVINWEATNKLKIQLNNAPANFAARGSFDGVGSDANWNGQGALSAVIWLEAGELVTVASLSSEGRYRQNGMHSTFGMVNHEIKYDLSIQPFRKDPDWYKVDLAGRSTAPMDWDDPVTFDTDFINLTGFLNNDMKTDDYIENFCKAFNLKLSQIDARTFALDTRQTRNTTISSQYIDLDGITSVTGRNNTPLGLPSLYKIGFTIDEDEIGYVGTQDNGGGEFSTGTQDESIVEQKSSFSYNWFKTITRTNGLGPIYTVDLPVISKADVWAPSMGYPEGMSKRFTDLALRFWYFDGLLTGDYDFNGAPLFLAKVKEARDRSILNYKNIKYSILDNYFTLLINGSSHYTEAEGYLTPELYQELDGSRLCMFNGDLYFIAEVLGYDPAGRNKTKLRLIRKIK